METSLVDPRDVLAVNLAKEGGWPVSLACGHMVWHPKAPGKRLRCGVCAQRLVRQIHEVCAEQTPPPYRTPARP